MRCLLFPVARPSPAGARCRTVARTPPPFLTALLSAAVFTGSPALAQHLETAKTATSAASIKEVFYGREDLPALESDLQGAKQAFEAAVDTWNRSEHTAGEPETDASRRVRDTEQRVERLQRAIKKARSAPSRTLVEHRYHYDRLVQRLQDIHQSLSEKGDLQPALTAAQRELLHLTEARNAVEKAALDPSPIYERLSAPEKLDEQLRLAEEQLAVVQRLRDHLNNHLFLHLTTLESRVQEAARIYQRLRTLWRPISASGRAVTYDGGATAPTELARLWITGGPSGSFGIRDYWVRLNSSTRRDYITLADFRGKLAEYQKTIDEWDFVITRLESDAERLRTVEAEKAREPRTTEVEPLVAQSATSKYVRIGAQINRAEDRLETLVVEKEKLRTLIKEVEEKLATQKQQEKNARQQLQAEANSLESHRSQAPLALPNGRGGTERRALFVQNFVLAERLSSLREHVRAIGRQVRHTEIQRDVLRRRLEVYDNEYAEIQHHRLPRLQRTYYLEVGKTVGIRGLRVGIVLFLAYTVLGIIRRGSGPFIEQMVERTLRRQGAAAIREQRARTIMSVFVGAGRFFIYLLAFLFVIGQLDIDYGPLLVAAGGLSLAVGFGAQALVRDFFAGFFILLEGQYSIGDVVDINGKSGIVEDLNLRTTIIRSVDGEVHTIPNGEITITSNKTKFWSRAVADISVAYEEDVDEVISVLGKIADEFRSHDHWAPKIREIQVLGVESFSENSVEIRVLIETTPGQQWAVSREFKKRVKMTFYELGIELPWPQRVISQKEAPSSSNSFAKHQRIRRYTGAMIEHAIDLTPPVSIEERDRAEAIANKEAAILKDQQAKEQTKKNDTETDVANEPPTLIDRPTKRPSSKAAAAIAYRPESGQEEQQKKRTPTTITHPGITNSAYLPNILTKTS